MQRFPFLRSGGFHINSYLTLDSVSLIRTSSKPANEITILDNISVEFPRATVTAVLGPSGAGKSTLLRMINRLEDPTCGIIWFDGNQIRTYSPQELRRRIGMVFQLPSLFSGSVRDNLNYGPSLWGETLSEEALNHLITSVDLSVDLLDRPSQNLSIGQQQRVAIARALANHPEVLLMDEPTSALDPTAAGHILRLMVDLKSRFGLTIIVVTHLLNHAEAIADRILLLEAGKKIAELSTPDFFSSELPIVRKFIQGELRPS